MALEMLYCWLLNGEMAQDIDWRSEAEAAEEVGFVCHSFDYQEFLEGDADLALETLPESDEGGKILLFRGWMMSADQYSQLNDAVESKGYIMHIQPHQYALTLELPNYFDLIESNTPRAVWTENNDVDEAWELSRKWTHLPMIVKDYVKSAKEQWLEACFIPANTDQQTFRSILTTLYECRGEHFTGGYVLRPFIKLKELGALWTGMPIYEEYRLMFWNGDLLVNGQYMAGKGGDEVNFSQFESIASSIDSSFFVMDVARKEDGEMTIIEINPACCAGLPGDIEPLDFYASIAEVVGMELPDFLL